MFCCSKKPCCPNHNLTLLGNPHRIPDSLCLVMKKGTQHSFLDPVDGLVDEGSDEANGKGAAALHVAFSTQATRNPHMGRHKKETIGYF